MKLLYLIVGLVLVSTLSLAQLDLEEPQKIVILSMTFEQNNLRVESVSVQYGSPPNRLPSTGGLVFTLRPESTAVLGSYEVADPRMVADIGYIDNVSFTVVLPYLRSASWVYVTNQNQTPLASFSIAESVAAFCRTPNNICDRDCANDADCPAKTEPKQETKPPADYTYLIVAAAAVLALALFFGYRLLKERQILREIRQARRR